MNGRCRRGPTENGNGRRRPGLESNRRKSRGKGSSRTNVMESVNHLANSGNLEKVI